jgi:uncharacterized SAM-binding protein YcdF (DUF218 family)
VVGVVIIAVAVASTYVLVPRHDEVGPVDAVVVLGGGGGERLALGLEIAEAQDVPLVLSAEGIDVGRDQGLACRVDVLCIDPEPVTTAGEAQTVAALARTHGWDRVAVTTSSFHVNRARLLFHQCFASDAVDVAGARADGSLPRDVYRYGRELLGHAAAVTVRRAC